MKKGRQTRDISFMYLDVSGSSMELLPSSSQYVQKLYHRSSTAGSERTTSSWFDRAAELSSVDGQASFRLK
jgi:hypothetical protein